MGAEQQRDYVAGLKREQITLRSGLEARGVVFRDVVSYYRVWNGFAATVRTRDIPRLSYTGSQVRTVRRAYPGQRRAGAGPRQARRSTRPGLNATPPVAVLDTGIDSGALNGHADPGYDAVDRDRDPKPGADRGRHRDERDRARGRDRRRRGARAADPDRLAAGLGRRRSRPSRPPTS